MEIDGSPSKAVYFTVYKRQRPDVCRRYDLPNEAQLQSKHRRVTIARAVNKKDKSFIGINGGCKTRMKGIDVVLFISFVLAANLRDAESVSSTAPIKNIVTLFLNIFSSLFPNATLSATLACLWKVSCDLNSCMFSYLFLIFYFYFNCKGYTRVLTKNSLRNIYYLTIAFFFFL